MQKCGVELGIAHDDVNTDDKMFKDFDPELDISFFSTRLQLVTDASRFI